MKIIQYPRGHIKIVLMTLIHLPLFVFNLWLIRKPESWSQLLHKPLLIQFILLTLTVIFCINRLLKAKWIGWVILVSFQSGLFLFNFWLVARVRDYTLGFYSLAWLLISLILDLQLFFNLKKPCFHSSRAWFEGLPRMIPEIQAHLYEKTKVGETAGVEADLSVLEENGCFAFPKFGKKVKEVERILLTLKEQSVEINARIISLDPEGSGCGLEFNLLSLDQRKEMRDFLNHVRSKGYV